MITREVKIQKLICCVKDFQAKGLSSMYCDILRLDIAFGNVTVKDSKGKVKELRFENNENILFEEME